MGGAKLMPFGKEGIYFDEMEKDNVKWKVLTTMFLRIRYL